MKKLITCLLVVAACGGGGKNDGNSDNTDAPGDNMMIDAPPAPLMITLSGKATERTIGGPQNVSGATIAAYANADENTALATTTTAADGTFSLTIMTTGTAVSGFLKATKTGLVDSYLYPPTAISADLAMIPMNMLSTSNYGTVYTLTGVGQDDTKGTIAMIVLSTSDPMSTPVAGATITSTPAAAAYKYNGANGLPSNGATSTAADGIGYALNAPAGAITVKANKSGSTFKDTSLKVHAKALTQTLVTP